MIDYSKYISDEVLPATGRKYFIPGQIWLARWNCGSGTVTTIYKILSTADSADYSIVKTLFDSENTTYTSMGCDSVIASRSILLTNIFIEEKIEEIVKTRLELIDV